MWKMPSYDSCAECKSTAEDYMLRILISNSIKNLQANHTALLLQKN